MKNKIITFVSTLGIIIGYLSSYEFAYADDFWVKIPKPVGVFNNMSSANEIIMTIFWAIIAISGFTFIILFLVGGIQYLAGAGNDEQTKKAKKLLVDAIVGLIAVIIAYAISTWVLNNL